MSTLYQAPVFLIRRDDLERLVTDQATLDALLDVGISATNCELGAALEGPAILLTDLKVRGA